MRVGIRHRRARPPGGPAGTCRRALLALLGVARASAVLRAVALGGALLVLPATTAAADSPAPDPAPSPSPATAPSTAEQAATPRLLLLAAPDVAPTLVTQIHRALATELRELPAEVVIALDDRPHAALPERILIGAAAARRTASIAAVWIDVDGDDLVLGVLDPRTEEVRLRRITGGQGRDATNLEAAALITRESLAVMLRRPPPSPPEPPRPRPPASEPRPRRFRLLVGYHGDLFADPDAVDRSRRWQSGVDLQLAYLWRTGAYAGLGGLFTGPLSLRAIPLVDDRFIDAKIHRVPIHAVAGYHRLFGRIGIEAEFGAGIDVLLAKTAVCDASSNQCTSADLDERERRVPPFGFMPRVRALFSPVADFFLFAGAGVDVFTDAKLYYRCKAEGCPADAQPQTLFSARNVRPVVQVGLLLRL